MNRLLSVTNKSDGSAVSYEYDALGRRTARTFGPSTGRSAPADAAHAVGVPVMIAFLGVVIGTIVVAMYLPMFSLISQIG